MPGRWRGEQRATKPAFGSEPVEPGHAGPKRAQTPFGRAGLGHTGDHESEVAPAEERDEVDQGVGEVPQLTEHVDRDGAVALGELLAVVAEHVGHVRIDRQVSAERAQDVDLRRRVRNVILTADDVAGSGSRNKRCV